MIGSRFSRHSRFWLIFLRLGWFLWLSASKEPRNLGYLSLDLNLEIRGSFKGHPRILSLDYLLPRPLIPSKFLIFCLPRPWKPSNFESDGEVFRWSRWHLATLIQTKGWFTIYVYNPRWVGGQKSMKIVNVLACNCKRRGGLVIKNL